MLEAKGWSPLRVEAYRTRLVRVLPPDARAALEEGRAQAITFTSASTVRGFVNAAPTVSGAPRIVCIGPVTAREARGHGFVVAAVARPHTIEGVVAALERALAPRPRSSSRGGGKRPGA
jgi:uroporphyrinogen-III synthase